MEPRPLAEVRSDFDRIARLSAGASDLLDPCERWLLARAPARMGESLDVGCGSGAFARELARRSRRVLAIDLSPEMIELARRRSSQLGNVDYRVEDATACDLGDGRFDCIVSIAMLHHVPARPMLLRLRAALAPRGVLLSQDLDDSTGPANLPRNALAWTVRRLRGLPRGSRELADAWRAHGSGETYPRMSEVRDLCAGVLPGALVRRHLTWRYSIVWRRPHGTMRG